MHSNDRTRPGAGALRVHEHMLERREEELRDRIVPVVALRVRRPLQIARIERTRVVLRCVLNFGTRMRSRPSGASSCARAACIASVASCLVSRSLVVRSARPVLDRPHSRSSRISPRRTGRHGAPIAGAPRNDSCDRAELIVVVSRIEFSGGSVGKRIPPTVECEWHPEKRHGRSPSGRPFARRVSSIRPRDSDWSDDTYSRPGTARRR